MTDDISALTVHITGRVQGVGYRDWTRHEARRLGLRGWVRNEADGSVRALIVGPKPAVGRMVERFWKGPQFASVSSVETVSAEVKELPPDFRITRS